MKNKILIILISSLFCLNAAYSQRILPLKEVRKMMEDSRIIDSLPCLIKTAHKDTIWGSDIDWEWNKKKKITEWHLDRDVYADDSVFYYQDKDGFHALLHFKLDAGKFSDKWTEDLARIVKGKMEVFITNWDSRGTSSTFNPGFTPGSNKLDPSKAGYVPGSGGYSPSQYYIREKNGKLTFLTYGILKEFISDNAAALALYNAEVKANENPNKTFTDWKILKSILEIYNQ